MPLRSSGPDKPFRFIEHVFPREYREIRQRRDATRAQLEAGLTVKPEEGGVGRIRQAEALAGPDCLEDQVVPPDVKPSTALELIGLSISGGGIRSATINLGVIQALQSYGILRHVDYLSTVSGGGYIGSCLSVMMRRPGDPFPFLPPEECKVKLDKSVTSSPNPPGWKLPETEVVNYLRAHSNYLTPNGFIDQVLIASVLLRGIFFNLLQLVPALLTIVALLALVYGDLLRRVAARGTPGIDAPPWGQVFLVTPWIVGLLALYFLVSPSMTRWLERVIPTLREKEEARGVGLRLAERVLKAVLDRADGSRDGRVSWVALRFYLERLLSVGLLSVVAVATFELQPVLIHVFHELATLDVDRDLALGGLAVVSGLVAVFMRRLTSGGGDLRLALIGITGMLLPVIVYLWVAERLIYAPGLQVIWGLPGPWAAIAGSFATYVLLQAVVDVNEYAPHRSYRDAISRAYLVGLDLDNKLGPEDDLKLSALSLRGAVVPYHLLNTALNLQGDPRLAHSGRRADMFVFSKHFIGSELAGYCPTEVVEHIDSHINLGTAMSISAAAASPNMGSFTVGPLVQLLTLFNIRCGYWAPNPDRVRQYFSLDPDNWTRGDWRQRVKKRWHLRDAIDRFWWIAGPSYLFSEMMGALTLSRRMVNISDGGHIENLGAYELLRRRVKYLVILDGEADPAMSFGAIATLARYARIDMGVEVEIDLSNLAVQADGRSRQHAAVGRIRYPARPELGLVAEEGMVLYLKSSLNGDEDEVIAEYKRSSPDFPHETTADQVFDEKQFEAYRSLGFHMADHIFSKAFKSEYYDQKGLRRDQLARVFYRLQIQLEPARSPSGTPARLKEQLGRVEALLTSPVLAPYVAQLSHERLLSARQMPEGEQGAVYRQQVLLTANAQLRLMEDVFFALELHEQRNREHAANAGWLVLFQRWGAAQDFRWAYALSVNTYSKAFRLFCQYALGLRMQISWQPASAAAVARAGVSDTPTLLGVEAARRGGGENAFLLGTLWVMGEPLDPPLPVAWASAVDPLDEGGGRGRTYDLAPGFQDAETADLVLEELQRRFVGLA